MTMWKINNLSCQFQWVDIILSPRRLSNNCSLYRDKTVAKWCQSLTIFWCVINAFILFKTFLFTKLSSWSTWYIEVEVCITAFYLFIHFVYYFQFQFLTIHFQWARIMQSPVAFIILCHFPLREDIHNVIQSNSGIHLFLI